MNNSKWLNKTLHGDCLEVLTRLPDKSVNLIVTSPPYADNRKASYGGVHPDKYVEWFLPRAEQFKRVLKDDSTFILNIKEKVVDCERHTYVLELILALKKAGWLWTEEYIWHKRNSAPGKWSNRFRDSWERCLQFNKQKRFKMYQDEVMIPVGDWAKTRLNKLGKNDVVRFTSQSESGFGKNIANWVGREKAYPTNVLHLATECGNKNHSAAFPKELPTWFIKLFTEKDDVVLDPFAGSGTTCLAAKSLERNYVGVELKAEYHQLALANLDETLPLPASVAKAAQQSLL
jgi:DNA modification methylase